LNMMLSMLPVWFRCRSSQATCLGNICFEDHPLFNATSTGKQRGWGSDCQRPKALKLKGLNKALTKALVIFRRKFHPWPSLRASRVYNYVFLLHWWWHPVSNSNHGGKPAMGLFLAQGQTKFFYVHVLLQEMCHCGIR
jgi:hypothetical protein